ncbi:expansin EXLX1 family cellulose-binding protein [Streptomyces sp. CoH27]|uniref:expansin EXLX1 family cellulose-binding protein n=1 Tax=Streptomyces sp. CoH27 TaxID=2875763 RepID=UPI001CD3C400|nr:expansin EXLX1 family cellulose-binding protein [Streptomyces sp. CoH27]
MASRSHRRTVPRRRTALVTAVALAVAGLVVTLAMAFRPAHQADTVRAASTPTAAEPTGKPQPKPTPTPTPSTASPAPTTSTPATHTAHATPASSAQQSSTTTSPTAPRPASGAAPLAGRIKPGVTYSGVATHYAAGDGDGACLYGPSPDLMVAAMNHTDYEVSKACGAYLLVRTAGGASVTVRITNECPECAPGQLDLSEQAFAGLGALSAGRIPITWSLLSPGTSDPIAIRYKTGSSRDWCGIQALGHRNPLARLEVRDGGGWRQLTRTDYDYFLSPDGTGCGGSLRLTDIYGQQLTVDGIAVRPDVVQSTHVQFALR